MAYPSETVMPDADWSNESSVKLQQVVDWFGSAPDLRDIGFSVTIADPALEDCPLVACSEGFMELCEYSLNEILGRNCRFLLDGVPQHYVDFDVRTKARQYIKDSNDISDSGLKHFEDATSSDRHLGDLVKKMGAPLTKGEILCVQTNAKKSGELFKNMFYMKHIQLNNRPFILGLQCELPEDWETVVGHEKLDTYCANAFKHLGKNMDALELALSRQFWYSAHIRRVGEPLLPTRIFHVSHEFETFMLQSHAPWMPAIRLLQRVPGFWPAARPKSWGIQTSNASTAVTVSTETVDWQSTCAPARLDVAFDPAKVKPWQPERFELIKKLKDAVRNQGTVSMMNDLDIGKIVAAKQMPNDWIQSSQETFERAHPTETEHPWRDIGCNQFLNDIGYAYVPGLVGVYRDADREITTVVSHCASGGDLFGWASDSRVPPGAREREDIVKPLAKQIAHAVQQLHNLSIVHRDLSLENVLIDVDSCGQQNVKVIDFGQALTERLFSCRRGFGKPSYRAPETHGDGISDGFLSDAYAFGMMLYGLVLMDYPWISTSPTGDRRHRFAEKFGLRKFLTKVKVPNSPTAVSEVLSEELIELLEGLLQCDPSKRLTLGEAAFADDPERKSVWDCAWMQR